jgi:hypothetical protein
MPYDPPGEFNNLIIKIQNSGPLGDFAQKAWTPPRDFGKNLCTYENLGQRYYKNFLGEIVQTFFLVEGHRVYEENI